MRLVCTDRLLYILYCTVTGLNAKGKSQKMTERRTIIIVEPNGQKTISGANMRGRGGLENVTKGEERSSLPISSDDRSWLD